MPNTLRRLLKKLSRKPRLHDPRVESQLSVVEEELGARPGRTTRDRGRHWLPPLLVMVVVLGGWSVVTAVNGQSPVLPGPLEVAAAFWELATNGTLVGHTVASLYRVTWGFYLAILVGFPAGVVIGRSPLLQRMFNPFIQFLRPISPLAWIPLAMLWFGIGDAPAIFLIFLASVFPILISTSVAVESINPVYLQVAANFGLSPWERVVGVILPAIAPAVVTALRLTLAIAWLVVVAAEMIAVQSGLGYLILDARNALRMDYVMVGMFAIGLIGIGLDYLVRQLDRLERLQWAKRKAE